MKLKSTAKIFLPVFLYSLYACSDGKDDTPVSVTKSHLLVRDTIHKQQVSEVFSEGSQEEEQVDEAKLLSTFQSSVHPVLVQRCSGCHASRVSPFFADPDSVKAYTALTQASKVDFSISANSRIVQRLSIEGHNCWSDCDANSVEMLAAVDKWVADSGISTTSDQSFNFVTPEVVKPDMVKVYETVSAPAGAPAVLELIIEAESITLPKNWQVSNQIKNAQNPEEFDFITALRGGNTYTVDEIGEVEGIAEFSIMFFVAEKADYVLYAHGAGLPNNDNEFFFRIDDEKKWSIGKFGTTGAFKYTRFDTRKWEPGPHFVTFRQKSANIRIDKFAAITRNPNAGNELTNLTGLTLKPTDPNAIPQGFMSFDISALTGVANTKFVVEAKAYTEKTYLFTNPFVLMSDKSKAFRVQNIKPLINGIFTPQHTHWMGVNTFIKAPFTLLTAIGMPMIADKGPAEDKISFAFEKFEALDPATVPAQGP